mmetsp:Transcript_12276/g.49265  ORF Transcript_12276/g.49265 Transcript_12276/m.49265 type:complete len:453 (+) Transcript_12276:172-1530(+)
MWRSGSVERSWGWQLEEPDGCLRRGFRLPRSARQRRVALVIVAVMVVYLFANVLLLAASGGGEVVTGEVKELEWNTAASDEEWVAALKYGKVVSCEVFQPKGSAISEKHLAVLEHDGSYYKAVIKLAQHPRYAAYTPPIYKKSQVQWRFKNSQEHEPQLEHLPHMLYRRAARSFQAVPEILSYHVDRIMGFYRKPPFVGRVLTNKELYGGITVFTGGNPLNWWKLFAAKRMSWGEETHVYVSLSPWMTGVKEWPPALTVKDFLVADMPMADAMAAVEADARRMHMIRTVSDTLVFDFLVDEHDRKAEKNWVVSKNGTYLNWDNGLAFDHGPILDEGCLRILCGHNSWRDVDYGLVQKTSCKKICRFRRQTYDKLRYLAQAPQGLGDLLEKRMQADVLAPGFHLLLYERYWRDDRPVAFRPHEMYASVNLRVHRLIKHIEDCVAHYGESEVFI